MRKVSRRAFTARRLSARCAALRRRRRSPCPRPLPPHMKVLQLTRAAPAMPVARRRFREAVSGLVVDSPSRSPRLRAAAGTTRRLRGCDPGARPRRAPAGRPGRARLAWSCILDHAVSRRAQLCRRCTCAVRLKLGRRKQATTIFRRTRTRPAASCQRRPTPPQLAPAAWWAIHPAALHSRERAAAAAPLRCRPQR